VPTHFGRVLSSKGLQLLAPYVLGIYTLHRPIIFHFIKLKHEHEFDWFYFAAVFCTTIVSAVVVQTVTDNAHLHLLACARYRHAEMI